MSRTPNNATRGLPDDADPALSLADLNVGNFKKYIKRAMKSKNDSILQSLSGRKALGLSDKKLAKNYKSAAPSNRYKSNIQKLLKKSVDGMDQMHDEEDFDRLEELMIVRKIDKMFKQPKALKKSVFAQKVNTKMHMPSKKRFVTQDPAADQMDGLDPTDDKLPNVGISYNQSIESI